MIKKNINQELGQHLEEIGKVVGSSESSHLEHNVKVLHQRTILKMGDIMPLL